MLLKNYLLHSLKHFTLSNKTIEDIDWLVPHQANQRIILGVADKLKLNHKKIISTVSDHGNTSCSINSFALDSAISSNKIINGNLIAFQAIGGWFKLGSFTS